MASSKEPDQISEKIKPEAVPFGIDVQDVFCLNKKDASDEEQGSAEACDMAYYSNWMPFVDNSYCEDVDPSLTSYCYPEITRTSTDRQSPDSSDEWMPSVLVHFPFDQPLDGFKIDPSLMIAANCVSATEERMDDRYRQARSETKKPQRNQGSVKLGKQDKWYPPVKPSILESGDVLVRRASQNARDGSERITVHLKSIEDGYKWRKYGQKSVKGNIYPRSYYKCTYPGCQCRKQVERSPLEEDIILSTYEGLHCHPPCPAKKMINSN